MSRLSPFAPPPYLVFGQSKELSADVISSHSIYIPQSYLNANLIPASPAEDPTIGRVRTIDEAPPPPPRLPTVEEKSNSVSMVPYSSSHPHSSAARKRALGFLSSIPATSDKRNAVFFDDTIFVDIPLSLGSRYYQGVFKARCSITGNLFTFSSVYHGAYPWGRSS